MKGYIDNITVKNVDGKYINFRNLTLNANGVLEFSGSNIFDLLNVSYLYDEEKKAIKITGLSEDVIINLPEKNIAVIEKFKREILSDLNKFYRSIVSGKEKLVCFPISDKSSEFSYLITTETILEKEWCSPKYVDALVYAFSDECLEEFGIEKRPNIKNFEDLQTKLGEAIIKLNLETIDYNGSNAVVTTLKEIIMGVD